MIYPGITNIDDEKRINTFVDMIFKSNQMFNLTGYKTVTDIQKHLINESLMPFHAINVPRGTLIADMGAGAGIPGIPLCIRFNTSMITMFDSTLKKIEFINDVIDILGIQNGQTVNGRIEEMGKKTEYRETFDWVTTRAMADPYTAVELGSSLVKTKGYMYLYTNEKQGLIDDKTVEHFNILGMRIVSGQDKKDIFNADCTGILLLKTIKTDFKYPRRINVIKRESSRIYTHKK